MIPKNYSNDMNMNQRIATLERLWHVPFPKATLIRQTNLHEVLPSELKTRWWNASGDEKNAIMVEYFGVDYNL